MPDRGVTNEISGAHGRASPGMTHRLWAGVVMIATSLGAHGQTAPSEAEIDAYRGIHLAVTEGDINEVRRLAGSGEDLDVRDGHGRTALMIATYHRNEKIAEVLIANGADVNAMDSQRYDILTIAAVRDDLPLLELALDGGADPAAITSPYDGTALIAAAHLGHVQIVQRLVDAGAPVDHVNNLKWTALIEAIILGDGGPRYQQVVTVLIEAGADVNLADGNGFTPLQLATARGHRAIRRVLLRNGARP